MGVQISAMLYEHASHTRLPTAGFLEVWACADYGSRDRHQDDQNKDLCPFVSLSFKQLIMGQTASNIASAARSWLGGIVAHLAALIIAPILRRVSKKFSPSHPLDAQMDDLLAVVRGLSERVDLLRGDLAARPDPLPAAVTGLSSQIEHLREFLTARPNPLPAVTGLSSQVEHLREFLAARPDPAPQEITIRVIHAPRARRRRRRREPADSSSRSPRVG